jgi:hypothetical protein
MRFRKPPLSPAEVAGRQAAGQTNQIERDWLALFGSTQVYPRAATRSALTPWLAGHPTTGATRETAAIHEAGHFVAFERMGMIAATARIYGPAGGRGAWTGTAGAAGSPDRYQVENAKTSGWEPLWGEAIATLAGPIAEELVGRGEALSSIGELVGASLWAVRVGKLTGQPGDATVFKAVVETTSIVERLASEIRHIGDVLAGRKRISRDRSIESILSHVPRGPIAASPSSQNGKALCSKIMIAFEQVWFSAPALCS